MTDALQVYVSFLHFISTLVLVHRPAGFGKIPRGGDATASGRIQLNPHRALWHTSAC